MTYVERGKLPKDRSSGSSPLIPPATTESPLCTWSVGQKKPGLWVGALGRRLFLKQTRETKPDNATRPGAHDRDQTHTRNPKRRPEARSHPHSQDTRKQAPGNGRTDEPENQVAFPTLQFDLRRGTLAVLPPSRVSPVLISRLRHRCGPSKREPHWIPIQCGRHVVARTHLVLVVRLENSQRPANPPAWN